MTDLTPEQKTAVQAAFQAVLDKVCHWEWIGDVCTGSSMYATDVARIMSEVMKDLGIEARADLIAARDNDPVWRDLANLRAENTRLRERIAKIDDTANAALREALREVAGKAQAALAAQA